MNKIPLNLINVLGKAQAGSPVIYNGFELVVLNPAYGPEALRTKLLAVEDLLKTVNERSVKTDRLAVTLEPEVEAAGLAIAQLQSDVNHLSLLVESPTGLTGRMADLEVRVARLEGQMSDVLLDLTKLKLDVDFIRSGNLYLAGSGIKIKPITTGSFAGSFEITTDLPTENLLNSPNQTITIEQVQGDSGSTVQYDLDINIGKVVNSVTIKGEQMIDVKANPNGGVIITPNHHLIRGDEFIEVSQNTDGQFILSWVGGEPSGGGGGGSQVDYTAGEYIKISGGSISVDLQALAPALGVTEYTAGKNISILNGQISCTFPDPVVYSAGSGISIVGDKIVNTAQGKTYTAGAGIRLEGTQIINDAPGVQYQAGTGIQIQNGVISADMGGVVGGKLLYQIYTSGTMTRTADLDILTAGSFLPVGGPVAVTFSACFEPVTTGLNSPTTSIGIVVVRDQGVVRKNVFNSTAYSQELSGPRSFSFVDTPDNNGEIVNYEIYMICNKSPAQFNVKQRALLVFGATT